MNRDLLRHPHSVRTPLSLRRPRCAYHAGAGRQRTVLSPIPPVQIPQFRSELSVRDETGGRKVLAKKCNKLRQLTKREFVIMSVAAFLRPRQQKKHLFNSESGFAPASSLRSDSAFATQTTLCLSRRGGTTTHCVVAYSARSNPDFSAGANKKSTFSGAFPGAGGEIGI